MIKNYIDEKKFFLIIFIVSIFSLISAIYIEYVLKIYPCKLCIYQRIPFILSIFICFFGYNLNDKTIWLVALVSIFTLNAFLSGYHVGIENSIFSEFSGCTNDSLNIQDKDQLLNKLKDINVSCKDVVFKIFGLSLATINLIISLMSEQFFLNLLIVLYLGHSDNIKLLLIIFL